MTTFDLPPEMAARLAQTITDGGTTHVEIVAGDWVRGTKMPSRYNPPARFVALDKACETCGGTGEIPNIEWMPRYPSWLPRAKPCPDCKDGRQVHELRMMCPTCGGEGHWCACKPARHEYVLCKYCEGGSVLVCRAVVRVVPVVDYDDNKTRPIILRWGNRCIYYDGELERDLHLDPLPRPGQDFGIVFEVVS